MYVNYMDFVIFELLVGANVVFYTLIVVALLKLCGVTGSTKTVYLIPDYETQPLEERESAGYEEWLKNEILDEQECEAEPIELHEVGEGEPVD